MPSSARRTDGWALAAPFVKPDRLRTRGRVGVGSPKVDRVLKLAEPIAGEFECEVFEVELKEVPPRRLLRVPSEQLDAEPRGHWTTATSQRCDVLGQQAVSGSYLLEVSSPRCEPAASYPGTPPRGGAGAGAVPVFTRKACAEVRAGWSRRPSQRTMGAWFGAGKRDGDQRDDRRQRESRQRNSVPCCRPKPAKAAKNISTGSESRARHAEGWPERSNLGMRQRLATLRPLTVNSPGERPRCASSAPANTGVINHLHQPVPAGNRLTNTRTGGPSHPGLVQRGRMPSQPAILHAPAALVEPPRAICTAIARSGTKPRVTSQLRRAISRSNRRCARRIGGHAGVTPSPSQGCNRAIRPTPVIEVMVEAVPIVLQVPGVRVMRLSGQRHCVASILPACSSSQMRVCVPAPMVRYAVLHMPVVEHRAGGTER